MRFRPYIHKRSMLIPPRLDEDISENDPVRLVNALIDGLDIDGFKNLYRAMGKSPYHPKMMLKVIFYAYLNNVYLSREIEQALRRDVHFLWLVGRETPDFSTINRFRIKSKKEIHQIFTHMVVILVQKGLLSLEVEYMDSRKVESKANKYTFVWRKKVEPNIDRLQGQVRMLLSQVEDDIAEEMRRERNLKREEKVKVAPELLSQMATHIKAEYQKPPSPDPTSL